VGARPANRPDAPASRGISHTRVLLPRSPGAAASRSWFVLQGLTTAGSTVIGFDAPVTTLASRPGPHRLPRDRFPDRLTGRVRSPRELPPLLPRHGTLRPARHRADPLEGATSHRAPLSRFRRPFSAREWRRPPRPARRPTERGFFLPLRSVLAVSTTSTACSAIHSCPGFPARHSWDSTFSWDSRFARASAFPLRPSPPGVTDRPCLRSRFRLHRSTHLQGFARLVRAEARSRIDRVRRRSVSLTPGLDPHEILWVGTFPLPPPKGRTELGPVTCSEL